MVVECYQRQNCLKAELLPFDNAKMKGEDEKLLLIDGPLIWSNPDHTMQSNGVQRSAKGLMFFCFFMLCFLYLEMFISSLLEWKRCWLIIQLNFVKVLNLTTCSTVG